MTHDILERATHDTLKRAIENGYIPLSSLPSHDQADPERDRLTWDFPLSTVDTQRILVDSMRLQRIQKLAALQSSHVLEEQDDGTFLAAARPSDASQVNQYSVILDFSPTPGVKSDFVQTQSSHVLNRRNLLPELVGKMNLVSDLSDAPYSPKKGMSHEKAWATTLDPVLRASLREAARMNLLDRVSAMSAETQAAAFLLGSLIEGVQVLNGNYVQSLADAGVIAGLWGLGVAASAVGNKLVHGSSYLKDFKWSMFRTMQPDRYLAVSALTRLPLLSVLP